MGALERNPRRPTGRAQSCSRTQRRTSRPRSNLGRNRTTVATAAPLHSRRPDREQCRVTQTFALQRARVGPGFNLPPHVVVAGSDIAAEAIVVVRRPLIAKAVA